MLILWILLGLLLAMAILTWWQPVRYGEIVGLTAIAPVLYLAAWPCAVIAGLAHSWPAFALATALVVSHLLFALPSMWPWSTAAPSSGGWRLTAYVHNVLYGNVDLTAVAAQIEREAPDLVVLIELAHGNVDSLTAADVLASYPDSAVRLDHGGSGCGIWSKISMTDARFGIEADHCMFTAILRPDDRPPITLFVIHTTAPITVARSAAWVKDLDVIRANAAATSGPVIMTGDFNATLSMRRLRRVLRSGQLLDAGATTGQGWRMTWRPTRRWLPWLMRLDHLFHSKDLTVTDYRLEASAGSDHRPLVVSIAAAQPKA
jgi:endonuclease/exonuclease/phosphatase (EEP) superfamily protein YafD